MWLKAAKETINYQGKLTDRRRLDFLAEVYLTWSHDIRSQSCVSEGSKRYQDLHLPPLIEPLDPLNVTIVHIRLHKKLNFPFDLHANATFTYSNNIALSFILYLMQVRKNKI